MKRKCLNHLNLHDYLSLRYTVLSFSSHFSFLLSSSKIYHGLSFPLEYFQCHSQKIYTSFACKFLKLFSCQRTMREITDQCICLICLFTYEPFNKFHSCKYVPHLYAKNSTDSTPFFKKRKSVLFELTKIDEYHSFK